MTPSEISTFASAVSKRRWKGVSRRMRVLAVGDIHIPAEHPEYLDFCRSIRRKWRTKQVVLIGDVFDWHAISFHQRELEADTADQEYAVARERVAKWHRAFGEGTKVCIGNHDCRVERLAASAGVPSQFVRSYNETWNTPGWDWQTDHHIDGVHYLHGTGLSGQRPALRAATASMIPTVCGHVHSQAGVAWSAGPSCSLWGLDTGCGVDVNHPAMNYGRNLLTKPVLGCGVVIDGHPYFERMET
ncbi:metallophosphoesterase [Herbaspirillum sp.]|uniref:metallophosphoesterase n=1 Tax=Herbaspirillum sp. TaxID=1890675 RepID=UPI00257F922C|nr:metallophosphoesterase [Herbaspirillum sp.]